MIAREYKCTDRERADLVSLKNLPGFEVLMSIGESEVEKFNILLLNTSIDDKAARDERWYLAKAAAQVWAGFVKRINQECTSLLEGQHARQSQENVRQGKLDELYDPTEDLMKD